MAFTWSNPCECLFIGKRHNKVGHFTLFISKTSLKVIFLLQFSSEIGKFAHIFELE